MNPSTHRLSARLMRNSHSFAPVLASFMLGAFSNAQAQQSAYTMDWTTASFVGMGPNGGVVVVSYNLTSGPAVAGLGSSYSTTFTVSDLTGIGGAAGNDYVWYQPGLNQTNWANVIGTEFDIASLLTNLPANNLETGEGLSDNGVSPTSLESADGFYRSNIAAGNLDQLGTFTVSTSAAPLVAGYTIVNDSVEYFSRFNDVSTTAHPGYLQQGVWAAPEGSPDGPTVFALSGSLFLAHGQTATFDFTAYDNVDTTDQIFQNGRGFWNATGTVTYEVVPEPSGVMMLGAAGLVSVFRRRRIK